MIILQKAILVLPLTFQVLTNSSQHQLKPSDYNGYSNSQPKFKNTLNYNTISAQELIEENNNKILQQIFLDSVSSRTNSNN